MRNITISKGLDIPISGEVTDLEITKHITKKVAVLGKDYHDLKPTMLVKVGEKVIKGQKLFGMMHDGSPANHQKKYNFFK